MERKRSLTGAAAAAAVLALAGGCTTPGKPGSSFSLFSKPPEMPQPTRPPGDNLDGGVRQASATIPAMPAGMSSSIAWLTGKGDKAAAAAAGKAAAREITVLWQPRLAYLPDPSKGGATGGGLTGNLFLVGPGDQAVVPNGKLTVDLYDETVRPGNNPNQLRERWEIDKDTLKRLATNHELLGRSYVLFLPWPSYRPDVTKVKLTVRYDPEHGYPLWADPSSITIDPSAPAGTPVWNGTAQTWVPGQNPPPPSLLPPGFGPGQPPPGGPPAGLPPTAGGLMPTAGFGPPAAGAAPPVGYGQPMTGPVPAGGFGPPATAVFPAGGPQPMTAAPSQAGMGAMPLLPPPGSAQVPPGGLPPIVITPAQRGQ
jgi:hypothetical protein